MKTISFALVSAGLLALTACGGGNKANNSTTATNTAGTTEIGSEATLPPAGELGGANASGSLGAGSNASGNAAGAAGAATNGSGAATANSTTNSH
jgi:hypothetical protein